MKCPYACRTIDHVMSRRSFLGQVGAIGAGLGVSSFVQPAVASQLKTNHKRILTIFLHGGVSQLESWDPKPNTDTGGPFRAIPTSVPGVHISELLPYTAKQMHHLSLVRGINTKNGDHGKGQVEMLTGRTRTPGTDYPHLGALAAKTLASESFPLPGHILVKGERGGVAGPAYLGPKFAAVELDGAKPPQYAERAADLTEATDARRNRFRQLANDHFAAKRRSADTDAYTFSYEQAQQLLAQRDVFELAKEPAKEHDKYGKSEFGQHLLLARRLIENDIPFVQVNHADYDSHYENFDFHIEQLGEFDRPFATLIADLAERELLKDTLIIVMSEFGRTPKINAGYGRDHWGTAWSVALAGCGLQHGAVVGKTNANGTAVVDREVDHGHLLHTYLRAVGVDSKNEFTIGGRKLPIADPAKSAIQELLA
ncbi:MAG: DUF1501 domain-containing protein [Planctomycetes bacterium]|nr:DUF1501 domain-containing protein [Planctomycetota bacterium]